LPDQAPVGWKGWTKGAALFLRDKRDRDDGKRFVVRADEKLTAFMELESAIWKRGQFS
jgi:hypothetical protein